MTPRQAARAMLDRLWDQVDARLPVRAQYGGPLQLVELDELARVAGVARDLVAAERDWHELPPDPAPAGDDG
jgi:hypothetical protein